MHQKKISQGPYGTAHSNWILSTIRKCSTNFKMQPYGLSTCLFKKFQLSDAYSLEIPLQTQKYVCKVYRKGLNIRFEKKKNRNQGR